MSKANPRKAVAALLPVPIRTSGVEVRPLTLGTFAILERIKSPLLGETKVDGTLSLLPSLYVLTHDPMDSLTGDLFRKSIDWADTLPPGAIAEIRAACDRQIRTMIDVVPEIEDDGGSKKKDTRGTTAGSLSLRSGRPEPTAGAGRKRSGAPLRAQSPSSGGSTGRHRA